MKWNKIAVDKTLVRSFVKEYNMSVPMATILIRRGILTKEELPFYFFLDSSNLHQPFLFKDMERAVDRILRAKEEGEYVLVYGDKDVDGITGTTIIVKALQSLGIHIEWQVPTGVHAYSFSKEDIQKFYDRNISLIITIDCGISSHKEVDFAHSLGMDVLIFDHHTPGKDIPEAYAIINAKIKEQGYPFEGISAGVLAAKLYTALLFSQTPLYQQDICLLNAVPLNDVLNIELICVRNAVQKWRKTITVSHQLEQAKEELQSTLSNVPIYVFNAHIQETLMYKFLGNSFDIFLTDIQEDWKKNYPHLAANSLLELKEKKIVGPFSPSSMSEIEILFTVYTKIMTKAMSCFSTAIDEVFDIAAISTIADIMPLKNENRIILQQGISTMKSSPNCGLDALLRALKLHNKPINAQTIGWKIAPVINAAGRMGQAHLAVQLLLEEDTEKASEYVEQLIVLNKKRISQMDTCKEQVYTQASESLEQNKHFVIVHNEDIPHSFTGAFANTILMKYTVPAIVITKLDDDVMNASIRCEKYMNATHLIEHLRPLLIDGGGHKAAAGFSFFKHQYTQIIQHIQQHVPILMRAAEQQDTNESTNIDLEIPEQYFNVQELKEIITTLAPFGEQWPPIVLLMQNISIASFDMMGDTGQHLKLIVKIGKYHIPAIVWNYDKEGVSIEVLKKTKAVSFLCTIKIDEYNGQEQFTLIIKEMDYCNN